MAFACTTKRMSRSKRYKQGEEKISKGKTYPLSEAIALVKESPVKFDAGVELHIKLGIDPKKSSQLSRGTTVLPHGTGKTKRVAAFVNEAKQAEAKEAGADIIGGEDEIAKIKETGKCDFDVAVATPDMMKKLGPIAKILGQQGLMPNPKTETVGEDVKRMVSELKGGKMAFRNDDSGNLHMLVGRVSFTTEQITENVNTALEAVRKSRAPEVKGEFIRGAVLSASMGPAIRFSVK